YEKPAPGRSEAVAENQPRPVGLPRRQFHLRRRRRRAAQKLSYQSEMAAEEDSIEQAAATRRERLRALRAAQELMNTPDEDTNQAESKKDKEDAMDEEEALNVKFRNYVPHDKQLQEGKLAPPELPKFEDPIVTAPPPEKKEDPFLNIAPKKPNWDLRRDVQKRLDKLERRTQKALCKLLEEEEKQRLLEAGGEDEDMLD
ncbi:hypothetical protein Dimus_028677, partial [Dionaea muscipula]